MLGATALRATAHVPELWLHLADDLPALWERLQAVDPDAPPPYWAEAWVGGQALARHVLDTPEAVAGRRVLDLATGSGLVALAAARAGAAHVLAVDVDPVAGAATALNARANGLAVEVRVADLLDTPPPAVDVVLAGDVCYEQPMAARVLAWLARARSRGAEVLVGEPGRDHPPRDGVEVLGEHVVATTRTVEGVERKRVRVLRLTG